DRGVLREPAAQPTIPEARVVRSVILELPAEHLLIELLGPADIAGAELDVVDLAVMVARRHSSPPACPARPAPGRRNPKLPRRAGRIQVRAKRRITRRHVPAMEGHIFRERAHK